MVDPAKETTALKVICLMYIVSKETKSIQDSEADTTSSGRNPSSVDIQTLIHRNEPNRPHISSVIKFSKSVETKSTESANLPSATRQSYLRVYSRFPSSSFRSIPFRVPTSASAAPVKGLLRLVAQARNPFFWLLSSFFHEPGFLRNIKGLGEKSARFTPSGATKFPHPGTPLSYIWGYPQSYPQNPVNPAKGTRLKPADSAASAAISAPTGPESRPDKPAVRSEIPC